MKTIERQIKARSFASNLRPKQWLIESPSGELFACDNLQEWCQENEKGFDDDFGEGEYRQPLWMRAMKGIMRQAKSHSNPMLQWRGWILLEKRER